MIYTEMTIKAMKIAYEAHAGQVDYNNCWLEQTCEFGKIGFLN